MDSMDYNITEDMKKTKANITMFELSKLKHQHKLVLKELNVVPSFPLPNAIISKATNEIGKPPRGRVEATNAILIEDRSNAKWVFKMQKFNGLKDPCLYGKAVGNVNLVFLASFLSISDP